MAGQYEGKVALVTGGNMGIGLAAVKAFAKEGAKTAFCARGEEAGKKLEKELLDQGCDVMFIKCDVTKSNEVEAMIKKIVDKYGRLDCAYNNAGHVGLIEPTNLLDFPEEAMRAANDLNIMGTFLCMKYEIAQMVKQGKGGAIVNASSICGPEYVFPGYIAYVTGKSAVEVMSRAVATEVAQYGIRVNAMKAGLIDAGIIHEANKFIPEHIQELVNKTPIPRLGKPEEVADCVLFLCSDKAAFVTGASLVMDGGYTIQ